MEQKPRFHNLKKHSTFLCVASFLLSISACDNEDRTTVIFGRITDQNQGAVDSILIEASGLSGLFNLELIKQVYTDENGNYELVINAPKKYNSLDTGIPYLPVQNPKFQRNYDVDKIWKNGEQTTNCCTAKIGEKTEYNFQLKPQK